MSQTLHRLALGQDLRREVNKRIREVDDLFGSDGPLELICECGREGCSAKVTLTRAYFDGLLNDQGRILVAAEHRSSIEGHAVLVECEGFLVVATSELAAPA